jgi:hypothetical protein
MGNETIEGNTTSTSLDQALRRDAQEITLRDGLWKRLARSVRGMESTSLIKTIIHVINLEVISQYNRLLGIHLYRVLKQAQEKDDIHARGK